MSEPPDSPGPDCETLAEASSSHRYLLQMLLATIVVAIAPTVVVWWLRSAGVLGSYPLGAALGMALSLGAAYGGRALWQTRPGSRDILFGELLVWGYLLRAYRERKLRSASATLGLTSQAQLNMPDGLSREQQVKLLEDLAGALDARDATTHGHSQRVARYAWIIASRMGLPAEQIARVRTAAAVHDLGKILTPTSILRKPGALTDEEYEVMKRHAADGARMAAALHDPAITEMVRDHHERLDGSGYPSRLSGTEIPLGARIIAVADTFDAMTADRPYRAGRAHKHAFEVLEEEAGTKLDADAIRAFSRHYSGRRSIALWSSLTTIPSRMASMLGNGAGGFASGVKTAALAALVGGLASSTATLAQPATRREPALSTRAPQSQVVSSTGSGRSTASHASSSSTASPSIAAAVAGKRTGTSGATPSSVTTTGTSATGVANVAGPSLSGAAAGASAGSQRQGDSSDGESPAPNGHRGVEAESGSSRGSEPSSTPSSSSSGSSGPATSTPEAKSGKGKEAVKEVTEGVKGTVKEVTGKVKEVTGKVEEVKGKVEETTKGAVEETTGKVGKIVGKL